MKTLSLLAATAATAVALTAQQTLIIPSDVTATTEGGSSTGFPWDRDSATAANNDIRVQTAYDSTNFPVAGPIVITQLRFRANATSSTWAGGTYANVEVFLGEAGIDYTALATNIPYDQNYLTGVTPAPAYAGPVTVVGGTGNGTGVPAPFYVTVTLTTPFLYDPTTGNDLIVDVRHDGVFSTTSGSAATDASSQLSRRVYNSTDWLAASPTIASNTGMVCEVTYQPAQGIFASFTVDQSEIGPGTTVQFTDTSVTSNPSGIVAWNWDFDSNGTVDSTVQNPTFQFNGCGPQNVTLQVFDSTANASTTRAAVSVLAPDASFTFTVLTATPPFVVQFTDTSTRNPTAWSWDFDGDGNADSTSQSPQAVYPVFGVFSPSLTASNACGSDVASDVIVTANSLRTQFGGTAGWNSGGAFYIDVDVTNPAGITIEALGVQVQDTGIQSDVNVYVKPGRHAGFEADRNAWAWVASGGVPSSAGAPNETIIDVTNFGLPAGQWSIAVEYLLASGRFNYTTTGSTSATNADLALSGGAMYSPAFVGTTTFQPRNWNGAVYYSIGRNAGLFQVIGDGCAGSASGVASIGITNGGVPRVGQPLNLEIAGGPISQPVSFIALGFTNFNGLDLTSIGMPGCRQWPAIDLTLPAPTDASGNGAFGFVVPNLPSLVGGDIFVQGLFLDLPANRLGVILGDAAQATIGG